MSFDYQNDDLIKNAIEITIAACVPLPKHSQIAIVIYKKKHKKS